MIPEVFGTCIERHLSHGNSADRPGAGSSLAGQIQKYLSLDSCFMWNQQCIYCAGSEWDHHSRSDCSDKNASGLRSGIWMASAYFCGSGSRNTDNLIKKQTV